MTEGRKEREGVGGDTTLFVEKMLEAKMRGGPKDRVVKAKGKREPRRGLRKGEVGGKGTGGKKETVIRQRRKGGEEKQQKRE